MEAEIGHLPFRLPALALFPLLAEMLVPEYAVVCLIPDGATLHRDAYQICFTRSQSPCRLVVIQSFFILILLILPSLVFHHGYESDSWP